MSERAEEILIRVFNCYNRGEKYSIKTPSSSKIHEFNMAVKEIEQYIEFSERNMMKISMTLSEKGIEYCIENFI